MDISTYAIKTAKSKAIEQSVLVEFDQANMCKLDGFENKFDTILDIGCFHSLDDENQQVSYTNYLHEVCNLNAMIYLRAFSDANSKGGYPGPAVSKEELYEAFSNGWVIKELRHEEIEEFDHKIFAWFAEIHYKPIIRK